MPNYIRACFCINYSIQANQFHHLLISLGSLDCKYNVWNAGQAKGYSGPTNQELDVKENTLDQDTNLQKLAQLADWLATTEYFQIGLAWRIDGKLYSTGISQSSHHKNEPIHLEFGVEEGVFLPGRSTEFTPNQNPIFERFKQLLVEIIKHTKPTIGVINYEADLLCTTPTIYDSFAGWGNYFSQSILSQWSLNDLKLMLQLADEHIQIDSFGILMFIHPLAANQAWSERHQKVLELLQRNPII
jgi:hypothetical protein